MKTPALNTVVLFLLAFFAYNANANEMNLHEQKTAVNLLNTLRAQHGLSALIWEPSSRLQAAANVRAAELESRFSHTRPDGNDCSSVLKEFGIHFRRFGENIAYGTSLSAEGVVELWKNSPGHNANMLNRSFREVGLASWHGHNGNVYWVQLFLTE